MNMKSKFDIRASKFLSILALIACASQSFAVSLLEDDRLVSTYRNGIGQHGFSRTTRYPSGAFLDWDDPMQISSVGSDGFVAMGTNRMDNYYSFGRWGYDMSIFDITFRVDEATVIDLQGSLYGWSPMDSVVTLYGGGSETDPVVFSFSGGEFLDTGDSDDYTFGAVLTPGEYRLVLGLERVPTTSDINFGGRPKWEMSANFAPVPIPAAGWLMGFALLSLWRLR